MGARERGDRPAIGSAIARPDTQLISFPLFGPWGRWYPWYSNGFGWNLGFVTYNPWRYGATRWVWGRYGMWYDPYAYYPYWGDPYSHGASYGSYGSSGSRRTEEPKRLVGTIRLKVDPEDAKVYIDGALVGTADEFDGLRHHLELDGGRHELELRAEGYETYKGDLNVEAGKTRTERVKLKKIK